MELNKSKTILASSPKNNYRICLQSSDFHLSDSNQHLTELRETLLAFVHNEIRPIRKLLIDLLQSLMKKKAHTKVQKPFSACKHSSVNYLLIVLRKLYLLPHICRGMCSLDCFYVKIADALFVLDRSILRIREWACLTIAQTRQVILIPAEIS
jgi:hypothetical protein